MIEQIGYGNGIDSVADLIKRPHPVEMIIISGCTSRPSSGGFTLHDKAGLEADFGSVELFLGDSFGQALELIEGNVQGLLCSLGGSAGITEHRAAILQDVVSGGNTIAQAPLLSDLSKEPPTHSPGKDGDG